MNNAIVSFIEFLQSEIMVLICSFAPTIGIVVFVIFNSIRKTDLFSISYSTKEFKGLNQYSFRPQKTTNSDISFVLSESRFTIEIDSNSITPIDRDYIYHYYRLKLAFYKKLFFFSPFIAAFIYAVSQCKNGDGSGVGFLGEIVLFLPIALFMIMPYIIANYYNDRDENGFFMSILTILAFGSMLIFCSIIMLASSKYADQFEISIIPKCVAWNFIPLAIILYFLKTKLPSIKFK